MNLSAKKHIITLIALFLLMFNVLSIGYAESLPAIYQSFISDARWSESTDWASLQTPKLSSFTSYGCCAYCADFTKFCYGIDAPNGGDVFYNTSDITAGDILTVGNQADGTGHWFICLKRNGSSLYVAEGNYNGKVRVGWNYTISSNQSFSEDSRLFTAGYHFGKAHYTISYDANGGTGAPEPQIKIENVTLTLSDVIPAYEGHLFMGWAKTANASYSQYKPGSAFTENKDTVLYAVWAETKGKCWDGKCWWNLENEVLTIKPTGDPNLPLVNWPLGKSRKVIIENGVTFIPNHAFSSDTGIEEVSIAESVHEIQFGAFFRCTGIREIHIPEGVPTLYNETFMGCTQLKTIYIPHSVASIVMYTFAESGLTDVYYTGTEDEWKAIDVSSDGNQELLNANIHFLISGIKIDETHFPDQAFREYVKRFDKNDDAVLTETELAEVTEIRCTRMNIQSLKGIEFFTALRILICGSNQISELDLTALRELKEFDCSLNNLSQLSIAANPLLETVNCTGNHLSALNTSSNPSLRYLDLSLNNAGILIDLSQNAALESLYCGACGLNELNIQNNANLKILQCHQNNLINLDLSGNPQLENVLCFGNQLISLILSNNPNLSYLECQRNAFRSLDISSCPVLVNLIRTTERKEEYENIWYWGNANIGEYLVVDEDTELVLESGNEATISECVYSLDHNASTAVLVRCNNAALKKMSIPNTITWNGKKYKVTEVAEGVFKGFKKLSKVSVGKNVKSIGKEAFSGCTKLTSVSGGSGITSIGNSAFKGCKSLKSFTFNKKVSQIGSSAFNGCKKLTSLTVKTKKLKKSSIGTNAFKGVSKKVRVSCPSKKLSITYQQTFTEAGMPKTAEFIY